MNVYAAAMQIEKRDAGPYSRVTHSALRAFIVHAESAAQARTEAYTYYTNQYPHWYLAELVVEEVALYGVSTEGAAWAMEGAQPAVMPPLPELYYQGRFGRYPITATMLLDAGWTIVDGVWTEPPQLMSVDGAPC